MLEACFSAGTIEIEVAILFTLISIAGTRYKCYEQVQWEAAGQLCGQTLRTDLCHTSLRTVEGHRTGQLANTSAQDNSQKPK